MKWACIFYLACSFWNTAHQKGALAFIFSIVREFFALQTTKYNLTLSIFELFYWVHLIGCQAIHFTFSVLGKWSWHLAWIVCADFRLLGPRWKSRKLSEEVCRWFSCFKCGGGTRVFNIRRPHRGCCYVHSIYDSSSVASKTCICTIITFPSRGKPQTKRYTHYTKFAWGIEWYRYLQVQT